MHGGYRLRSTIHIHAPREGLPSFAHHNPHAQIVMRDVSGVGRNPGFNHTRPSQPQSFPLAMAAMTAKVPIPARVEAGKRSYNKTGGCCCDPPRPTLGATLRMQRERERCRTRLHSRPGRGKVACSEESLPHSRTPTPQSDSPFSQLPPSLGPFIQASSAGTATERKKAVSDSFDVWFRMINHKEPQ